MSLRFILALWDKNINLNMVNFAMLLVSLIASSKAIFPTSWSNFPSLKRFSYSIALKKYFEECSSPAWAIVRGPIYHVG